MPCDRIIARLGAIPPRKFVKSCGIGFPSTDPAALPTLDAHYQSTVPGLYVIGALGGLAGVGAAAASGTSAAREIAYAFTPPAPASQSREEVERKNQGCMSCHTDSDQKTMHASPAVKLACVDCHGGDNTVVLPAGTTNADPDYAKARDQAHIQPLSPQQWGYPCSATPERSYTLLNKESPGFVRFVNPSNLRAPAPASPYR